MDADVPAVSDRRDQQGRSGRHAVTVSSLRSATVELQCDCPGTLVAKAGDNGPGVRTERLSIGAPRSVRRPGTRDMSASPFPTHARTEPAVSEAIEGQPKERHGLGR